MIEIPSFENSLVTTVFYIFCFFVLIHFCHLFYFFSRLIFYKKKNHPEIEKLPAVSVIICGRNEADNYMDNLQSVLEQDYPHFEVVVVNHASVDDSADVLFAFQQEYKHLHVITVNRNSHTTYGKKFPLSVGIKGAKNEFLVLTDADCQPASNQWLKGIVSHYAVNKEKEIVLGFGPMNHKKGFLNWFLRMETNYIAIQYFSYALARIPYMSVGRNFAYTKELFIQNKGFKSHYSVPSGDDDLFLQEVVTKDNFSIELSPETWCYSDAKESWRSWIIQKKRHYSASPRYGVIKKLLLGSYSVSWLLTLILFVILFIDKEYAILSLLMFLGLLLIKWILFIFNFSRLKAIKMSIFFPIWETMYMFITPFIYFIEDDSKGRWK